MVTTVINDAKKVAYLVETYPEKDLDDIVAILSMPNIAKDCALWEAELQGWIALDKEKRGIKYLGERKSIVPNEDDSTLNIKSRVLYLLRHENGRQYDIDEFTLLSWLTGYLPHDILIAINTMVDDKVIAHYNIVDKENTYDFYTLPENVSNAWGKKNFKKKAGLKTKIKAEVEI